MPELGAVQRTLPVAYDCEIGVELSSICPTSPPEIAPVTFPVANESLIVVNRASPTKPPDSFGLEVVAPE